MNILFLSRWYPFPPDNGSKLRIYHLLKSLASRHTVDLIAFTEEEQDGAAAREAGQFCRKVSLVRYRPYQPDSLRALAGYLSPKPRSLVDTYQPEMGRLCLEAARQETYAAVVASQIDMSPYAAGLPIPTRLLDELEITPFYDHYQRQAHPLKRLRAWLTLLKLKGFLAGQLERFDGISTVSQMERQNLAAALGSERKLSIIPNGVDAAYYGGDFGQPQPDTLVYNGALTYSANFDAMLYFVGQVLPRIRAARPGVRLYITGSTRGVPLARLAAGEGVIFTGYLPDIRERVAQSWACVAPLRIGGGTRLKILEAMALGTPVVSTRKGAEGLDVQPGVDLLLADRPEEFASQVLRVLEDESLRSRLSAAGKKTVGACCDWASIGSQFNAWVESCAAPAA